MTLEEAIKHAEEKVKCGGKCGEDHAQLAGWLKELRERRVAEPEKRTAERTETHACDLISRHAVIYSFEFDDDGTPWNMGDIIYRLKQFPAAEIDLSEYSDELWKAAYERGKAEAQAERKTGKWLPDNRPGGGFWVCSCCKFPSEAFAADVLYKFCPNCGAYMGGDTDEVD